MNVQEMVTLLKLRLGDKTNRSLSNTQYVTEMNDSQNALLKLIPRNQLSALYTTARIIKATDADWSSANNYFDLEMLRSDVDKPASRTVDRVVDEGPTREIVDLISVIGKKTGIGFDAAGERDYRIVDAKTLFDRRNTLFAGDTTQPLVAMFWGSLGRGLYFHPNPETSETIDVMYLGAPRDMEYTMTVGATVNETSSGRYDIDINTFKRRWPGYYNGMIVYDYTTKSRYRVLDSHYDASHANTTVMTLSTFGDYTSTNEIATGHILSVESEFPEYMHDLIVDYTEMQRWGILKKPDNQQLVYKRLVDKINGMGGNLGGDDSK